MPAAIMLSKCRSERGGGDGLGSEEKQQQWRAENDVQFAREFKLIGY
jgi:hypothetical protein